MEMLRILLADQEQNAVGIYALTGDGLRPEWEFRAYWEEIFQDVRLRRDDIGRDILACANANRCGCIIDRAAGEVIWMTRQGPQNPHAAEILPGGILALAGSVGSAVAFFRYAGEHASDVPRAAYTLEDAHGLQYDPARGCLWALGYAALHRIRVTGLAEGGIAAETEAVYPLPFAPSGHDLWPAADGSGALWLTERDQVIRFEPDTGDFSRDYPGFAAVSRPHTKAVAPFPDGTVITLVPDGGYLPWTADVLRVCSPDAGTVREISIDGHAAYKVRPLAAKYMHDKENAT